MIPARSRRTDLPEHGHRLWRERNRIERLIEHLEENRRLATRCDRPADAFLAMLDNAASKLWRKLVNRFLAS